MVVVFDFDGTLHDTAYIYNVAMNKAMEVAVDMGLTEPRHLSEEETSAFLGKTPEEAWSSLIEALTNEELNTLIQLTGAAMDTLISQGKSRLYEGTKEVLKELKSRGIKQVILSNCTESYMESQRKAWNLDSLVDGSYPAEKYGYPSKVYLFDLIRKDFPGENLFIAVGDRFGDIEGAVKEGFPSIGCLYGFGAEEELEPATYKVRSIQEIPPIIKIL